MSVVSVLVEKGVITREEGAAAEADAGHLDVPVEHLLRKRGVPSSEISAAKGEDLNIPHRSINTDEISFDLLKHIPEESAVHYKFAPIGIADGVLEVGIVDPDNIEARDALAFISSKTNMPFKLFLISEEDFAKILESYKSLTGEVGQALSELKGDDVITVEREVADIAKKPSLDETQIIEDAPVTKIVATMLRYAIEGNASDIHVEPMSDKVRVRFRIDGDLHTSLVLPVSVHGQVAARIKVLSNMKLDERRKPQDGRFSAKIEGREVDFRVSTFPTSYGEKVVMRILDKERGIRDLSGTGLSEEHTRLIRRAVNKPYGMILISGPTGSGKSTTLYGMLQEVDKETKNVLSLEDPVEFNIDGVSQSQVRPDINYTFASGLRTTLRQDPDIIMVGEIRDKETAQLAIQAALTGHLVLSTIHTNTAVGVIPRLIDMGVDPFLIAPTLILTIAQRLTRKLCPGGGKPLPIEGSLRAWIDSKFADLPEHARAQAPTSGFLYELAQTPECPNGTRGRVGVYEMFEMDKDIEEAILRNPTELDIQNIVRKKGMLSLQEDAIIKCSKQIVPFEEVNSLSI